MTFDIFLADPIIITKQEFEELFIGQTRPGYTVVMIYAFNYLARINQN